MGNEFGFNKRNIFINRMNYYNSRINYSLFNQLNIFMQRIKHMNELALNTNLRIEAWPLFCIYLQREQDYHARSVC